MKVLENNLGGTLQDICIGNAFLERIQMKFYQKIQCFYAINQTVQEVKI